MTSIANESRIAVDQSIGLVTRAELRRAFRAGGMRTGFIVCTLTGILCGLAALLIVGSLLDGTTDRIGVTVPIEVTATVTGISMTILSATYASRDAKSGLLTTALTLVPRRLLLLIGRWLSVVLVGLIANAVSTSTIALLALILNSGSEDASVIAIGGVVSSSFATACMVSIAFFVATVAARPVASVLITISLLVILPMALSVVQNMLPANFAAVIGGMVAATPTPLFFGAIGISGASTSGAAPLILALAGLLGWTIGLGLLCTAVFRRRDT